jgi:phosphoribosylaminoimidazole-succinocarboxamide synthase
MSDEWIDTISKRYIQLFEKVTGTTFVPSILSEDELQQSVIGALHGLEIQ